MRVPVNERVKDVPASALRAMFAGIGSLLGVTDKVRNKQAAAEPEVPATPAEAEVTVVAEAPAEPEAAAEVEVESVVVVETVEVAEPEAIAEAAPAAADAAPAAADAAPAALPIANYDELSIASLRARLRNLSVEQLAELVAYEKGHAAREDVVAMFERRIAKVESEG